MYAVDRSFLRECQRKGGIKVRNSHRFPPCTPVKYEAELEEVLTSEVCKQQQGISRVGVSLDGQFAIYNVGGC
jgi:hypothetical protein